MAKSRSSSRRSSAQRDGKPNRGRPATASTTTGSSNIISGPGSRQRLSLLEACQQAGKIEDLQHDNAQDDFAIYRGELTDSLLRYASREHAVSAPPVAIEKPMRRRAR